MSLVRSIFVNLVLFAVTGLSFFSACDQIPGSNTEEPALSTTAGKAVHISQRLDLECGGKDYRVMRIDLEKGGEAVTMFKGADEVRTELLPGQGDIKKFKLDPLRKTDKGFEMSMEYGGRYYHSRRFEFECGDGGFRLVKMKSDRFDTNNPARISKKNTLVKPSVPFERFGLRLYLID